MRRGRSKFRNGNCWHTPGSFHMSGKQRTYRIRILEECATNRKQGIRKKCICKSPVFYSLRTLPSSVSCKSFACHSYENCRVYANNSHSGTYSSPASFVISLPPYLFASAPLPLPTTHSLQVP